MGCHESHGVRVERYGQWEVVRQYSRQYGTVALALDRTAEAKRVIERLAHGADRP